MTLFARMKTLVATAAVVALVSTGAMANEPRSAAGKAAFPFPLPIPSSGNSGGLPIPFPFPTGGGNGGNSGGLPIPFPFPTGGGNGGNTGGLPIPFPFPTGGGNGGDTGGFPIPNLPIDLGSIILGQPRKAPQTQRYPQPDSRPGTVSRDGQPSGYEPLQVRGRPARVAPQDLPLRLYSNSASRQRVVAHAVNEWNEAGQALGIGNLFEVVTSPSAADFPVDWSGRGLKGNVLGSAQMRMSNNRVVPVGVTLRANTNRPEGNMAEILTHELGHVLGIDHSDHQGDLMYHTERPRRLDSLPEEMFSQRDMQMLSWLYSQQEYVAISGARALSARR